MKCGNASAYDCEQCFPGLTKVTKGEYTYCAGASPSPSPSSPCSRDNPSACVREAYPITYLQPGEESSRCPTGLMFPASWDDGHGAGIGGEFRFEMVDQLEVPADAPPGEYSLSWRWDCEQTPQVWNSCADITITA
uniref:Chitin-binding type-4 domain-containing protein n=1 Tax=Prymnesium polylepis TaxID=72548 RepID=A0A6T8BFU4_9EUKA|mmetsp:Transcript_7333/g.19285  ORF Transcript_7333/g.19285 Transcript_7333/m.19285 type:complete len:136 (-) Transcript_7333:185-592(-)